VRAAITLSAHTRQALEAGQVEAQGRDLREPLHEQIALVIAQRAARRHELEDADRGAHGSITHNVAT
jgi:hypothetical protein